MKIAIGCDHGGYLLKQDILIWLEEHDIDFEDVGCFSTSVDYPIYGEKGGPAGGLRRMREGYRHLYYWHWHLHCRQQGQGYPLRPLFHRFPVCRDDPPSANDANVLALGAGITGNLAKRNVEVFLNTESLRAAAMPAGWVSWTASSPEAFA